MRLNDQKHWCLCVCLSIHERRLSHEFVFNVEKKSFQISFQIIPFHPAQQRGGYPFICGSPSEQIMPLCDWWCVSWLQLSDEKSPTKHDRFRMNRGKCVFWGGLVPQQKINGCKKGLFSGHWSFFWELIMLHFSNSIE